MKTALTALTFAALLAPAASFAHDYDRYDDRWPARRSRTAENFEREHPRWPRVYCHTHRYPLNPDDTRRHCHNWNVVSWEEARDRAGGGGWYGYERRDDRWRRGRYDTARNRRDWWWDRYR
jgi:hypothetical protein